MTEKNINRKKLLILGGISLSQEIIKYAKKLGTIVYVTDYLESSPAKKYADKSFMVSTTDVNALSKLVEDENIDGIITGFVDMLLHSYEALCKKTGRPCYATRKQIDILTDKVEFKEICRNFEIPVVEEYSLKNPLDEHSYKIIKYPVILKPADNSGGRGITICHNPDDFVANYNKTLSFSKSRKVLIEKFMNTQEVTIFYVLQNGEIKLSAMSDRHIQHFQDGVIPLPVAYTFPSIYLNEYERTIHPKVVKMFKHLGMKNGIVFIQSFVEDGKCIFYEIGYRITGSLEYKIIEHASGYNPLEMMIQQAISDSVIVDIEKLANPHFTNHYCNITFSAYPGTIETISGVNEILGMPNVIDMVLSYDQGDEIPKEALGTLAQVVARVFAHARTKEELILVMEDIYHKFKVTSVTGENMLLPPLNTNQLFQ